MVGIAPKVTPGLRSVQAKFAQGVLYVRHREQAPTDEDWQALLDEIARNVERDGSLRILVRTENAGPNVVQRSKLNELITAKHISLRIAVLSTSMLVRGIII